MKITTKARLFRALAILSFVLSGLALVLPWVITFLELSAKLANAGAPDTVAINGGISYNLLISLFIFAIFFAIGLFFRHTRNKLLAQL